MRDIERIEPFMNHLTQFWHQVPDWRFGQLLCNFLGYAASEAKSDPFFLEDDKFDELLTKYSTLFKR